jgi:pimeloyl-ACP methyl ester carboxylesterase
MNRTWVVLVVGMGCSGPKSNGGNPPPDPTPSPQIELAAVLPAQCTGNELFRVTRPVVMGEPSYGTWSYGYRFKPPTKANAPVLVYIPGGPGEPSTGAVPDILPDGWGYLLTDPRGVGCNTLAAVPPDDVAAKFFTTAEVSGDVAGAVADRGLSSYLVYGISYGSMAAENTAHLIEEEGIVPPVAVVVEGVIGRDYESHYMGEDKIALWEKSRPGIPQAVLNQLDTAAAPYGLQPDEWGRALFMVLCGGPDIVQLVFQGLSNPLTQDDIVAQLKTLAALPPLDPSVIALYFNIACHEWTDQMSPDGEEDDPLFEHGQLVRNPAIGGGCNGMKLTSPFDSAKLQFTSRLYAFVGDNDVSTPPWQGDYLYQNHQGPQMRITTIGGGHASLSVNQSTCTLAVLQSIAQGGSDLRAVLATCPSPVTVDQK